MNGLLTISLTSLRFFAFHGLYPEEKKTGNEFEVNLSVSYTPAEIVTDLDQSVNYANLYELLKIEMQQPRELLETFAMQLAEKIHASFSLVRKVEISIEKLHPPIAKFTGRVGVKYEKEF